MEFLKRIARWLAFSLPSRLVCLWEQALCILVPRFAGRVRGNVINDLFGKRETVVHNGLALTFHVPNSLAVYRTRTLATKEPETIAWIDSFAPGDVLWDIGANLGVYSVYAARKDPTAQVVSFEPSVFNLELLARNIDANNVSDRVVIVPLPLSDREQIADFGMSNVMHGAR